MNSPGCMDCEIKLNLNNQCFIFLNKGVKKYLKCKKY